MNQRRRLQGVWKNPQRIRENPYFHIWEISLKDPYSNVPAVYYKYKYVQTLNLLLIQYNFRDVNISRSLPASSVHPFIPFIRLYGNLRF